MFLQFMFLFLKESIREVIFVMSIEYVIMSCVAIRGFARTGFFSVIDLQNLTMMK
jgi:hypothetical protein